MRGAGVVTVDGGRRAGRVLHVLSEAYGTGGRTRQACAWMARDERRSDVVLTNQLGPVPDRLREAARAAGGELHDLRSTTPGLLDRARALRARMDLADLVVLTVHPWDVVALAAVNLPGVRPPVVHANHADHACWLGVGGADLVCDWRTHARWTSGCAACPASGSACCPARSTRSPPAGVTSCAAGSASARTPSWPSTSAPAGRSPLCGGAGCTR